MSDTDTNQGKWESWNGQGFVRQRVRSPSKQIRKIGCDKMYKTLNENMELEAGRVYDLVGVEKGLINQLVNLLYIEKVVDKSTNDLEVLKEWLVDVSMVRDDFVNVNM
jgi:hypothetical protein